MCETNTGGGTAIGGDANAGRDMVGRDQTIFVTVINQYAAENRHCDEQRAEGVELVTKWQNADLAAAEKRYRLHLIEHYGRIRIFGASSEVLLQNVFTDVYIFKEPLSRIHYNFESLRIEMAKVKRPQMHHRTNQRVNGMALVTEGDNLFIVGKPGAGKTTFLRYLTLQAAQGNLTRLPIFISLTEWVNSLYAKGHNPQLMPFIARQFEICQFNDVELFLEQLLSSGKALILFDGLDEVRQENDQRRLLTQLLKDFTRQYAQCQYLITCRIAASDYVFSGFRDVEVADFSNEQIIDYAKLWFHTVGNSYQMFIKELAKSENTGVRELCNSPLILSMVCLYFERIMRLPPNRAELYEDAIEALLNKWDASRDILRDEIPYGETIYRELSPRRKKQIFASVAARTFETGDYFFRRRDLEKWISEYITTLPNVTTGDDIGSTEVLRAIESQHGIFVERAKDIYSFSHLTFHEYFTARYIFDNERRGTTARLVHKHLTDNRWREVFLLTVSLFDREGAKDFFADMQHAIRQLITNDVLNHLLTRADAHSVALQSLNVKSSAARFAYIFLLLTCARDHVSFSVHFLPLAVALKCGRSLEIAIAHDMVFAHDLDRSRSISLDSDFPLVRAIERERATARAFALFLSYNLTFDLEHALSVQIGFDFGLYHAWNYAKYFSQEWWPRNEALIQDGIVVYPELIGRIMEMAKQIDRQNLIDTLEVPLVSADPQSWQQFADKLYVIMEKRNLIFDRQFTREQINQLNDYFYANELLIQCLNVAVVSDRQAILAGLLAPPQVDEGKTG